VTVSLKRNTEGIAFGISLLCSPKIRHLQN
jgi:hypothetical protein